MSATHSPRLGQRNPDSVTIAPRSVGVCTASKHKNPVGALLLATFTSLTLSCTTTPKMEDSPDKLQSTDVGKKDHGSKDSQHAAEVSGATKDSQDAPQAATEAPPAKGMENPQADCFPNPLADEVPKFYRELGTVVTAVNGSCVNFSGKKGIKDKSNWVAMGLPCTGGGGRVEWKGEYHNPKFASFIFGTDCPMAPKDSGELSGKTSGWFRQGPHSLLAAYYPMAVQYWELPDQNDADVGYSVELRTKISLQGAWDHFRNDQPVRVILYGRQNSWNGAGELFKAMGSIQKTGRNSFRFTLDQVNVLNAQEQEEVKQRCLNLSPKRNCSKAF